MKGLLKTILLVIVLLAVVSISLAVSNVLPYPLSKVNILYTALLMILALRPQGSVVWMSFLGHLFLELYALTPFGIILLSGTVSTLFVYWAYQYVFSNRSWYAMIAMSVSAICMYRVIYLVSLWIAHLIATDIVVAWESILVTTAWELLFTTILIGLLYLVFFYKDNKTPQPRWYVR